MSKPLCIDLFCGLGGWTEGFLAEGWDCVGFDIERHDYGTGGYPGQLVIQDVRTLHGSQFKSASLIVASPPCQKYSYMAMPWSRAKKMRQEYLDGTRSIDELNELFNVCFRIAREAGVPLIVENVRGAQGWVGNAAWNYGSFYLWGDLPALMPLRGAVKVSGLNWKGSDKPGYVARAFNTTAEQRLGDGLKGIPRTSGHWTNAAEHENGVKVALSGRAWYAEGLGKVGSKSSARRAASAHIAKIPRPLSTWIARCFKNEKVSTLR